MKLSSQCTQFTRNLCLDGFIYFLQPAQINPFSYKNMVRKSRLAERSELKLGEVFDNGFLARTDG